MDLFLPSSSSGGRSSDRDVTQKSLLEVRKAKRSLERESARIEREEPRVIRDIQNEAKKGQAKMVQILAKDLVRKRRQREKLVGFMSNMSEVETTIRTMGSVQTIASALKKVTVAMASANKRLNMPELNKVIMEFQKQVFTSDEQMKMMDDSLAEGNDEEEEETDAVVSQVLDEIGVDMAAVMSNGPQIPGGGVKARSPAMDPEMLARLRALKEPSN
jgi:charged multivesicular body protein 2A